MTEQQPPAVTTGICPRCSVPLDDHVWRVYTHVGVEYVDSPRCPEPKR